MQKSEVRAGVVDVVSKVLRVAPEQCRDSANIYKDLGADPMATLAIPFWLGQHFRCNVIENPLLGASQVTTIGDLVDWLQARMPAAGNDTIGKP